jgi:general secretion pathway protein L
MAQIVGLDIGSYSIKVVRIEARRGEFDVIGYEEEILGPSTENGVGVPLEDRQAEALVRLKEAGHLEADMFVTGLGGDMASIRTLAFPFSDAKKIELALPFELDSEIPFDLEDIVYSWTILGPKRNRQIEVSGEVRPPETEVLVAFAKREAVENHLLLLDEVGIDPRHVEFDALALDDLYEGVFRARIEAELNQGPAMTPGGTLVEAGPDAAEPAIAMVDIGHRRTSVCIVTADRVISAHTVLHGGADSTRALAREFGISVDEAERGKRKEAFVEVLGATAQFPEQRKISDILKRAYAPIVRRLRQTFQASMSSSRVRVVKVVLTGGGSRILNLDRHLAETLNVKVERGRDIATRLGSALPPMAASEQGDVPEAACALAYALSAHYGEKTRARIDFRTGEFAWKGNFDFVRDRAAALGAWAAVLLVTFLVGTGVQVWMLSNESDRLTGRLAAACKSITGQDLTSMLQCEAMIRERISGQAGFQIPDRSAADHYLEVSRRIPKQDIIDRKVTELEVTEDRVRLKAETVDFDAVDKIVAGLQDGVCFSEVEKGKARNSQERVEFQVTIKLDCQAAKGKPLPESQQVDLSAAKAKAKARPATTTSAATEKKPGDDKRAEARAKREADRKARLEKLEQRRKDLAEKRGSDEPRRLSVEEARDKRAEKKERIREQQRRFRELRNNGINPGREVGSREIQPNLPNRLKPMRSRDGKLPLPMPPKTPKGDE